MFTGIIQSVGRIEQRKNLSGGVSFAVSAPEFAQGLVPGDSVSVSGVCHTVEHAHSNRFVFTSVGETLKLTTLGMAQVGMSVNLERAATLETALGGHLVQGHVDGMGTVTSFETVGKDRLLSIRLPQALFELMVAKGSIAVDGVSLTIVERRVGGVVTITIVPFTVEKTIVGGYRVGTRVNIEADILGKYVMEYLNRLQIKSGMESR
jgi:riboflavin synthase